MSITQELDDFVSGKRCARRVSIVTHDNSRRSSCSLVAATLGPTDVFSSRRFSVILGGQ